MLRILGREMFVRYSLKTSIKKLVGYGFSLPLKPSLFNIGNFDLLGLLFDGRLKPYPTEFCDVNSGEQGRSPVGCSPRLHHFNIYLFGFDGVFRGKHPTDSKCY